MIYTKHGRPGQMNIIVIEVYEYRYIYISVTYSGSKPHATRRNYIATLRIKSRAKSQAFLYVNGHVEPWQFTFTSSENKLKLAYKLSQQSDIISI